MLAPTGFWEHILQGKLKNLLCRKLANRPIKSEDITVVASVTARSERDLAGRFDDTSIEWAVIEIQLVAWGKLFRAGNKLRLCKPLIKLCRHKSIVDYLIAEGRKKKLFMNNSTDAR